MILGLAANAVASPARASAQPAANSKTLVAYFSRSGNTRVIAGQLRRIFGADLFEIQPAQPYPEDYDETVRQAQRERESGFEPPLRETVPQLGSYDTVFLGFPIWGTSAPAVVRAFLSRHDVAGKKLVPFVTHGGYGLGDSLAVLARHAPGAKLAPEFSLRADAERETQTRVKQWLSRSRIANQVSGSR